MRAARLEATNSELSEVNRELESFSYSVSHDLRAPLRAVDGFARMLEEDYASKLDEEGRRYVDVVRDNARRMGQLIDDLLAFSRLGRTPLERRAVDMAALVRAAWREIGGVDGVPHATLITGPLPSANGDPALVKQVVVNLLEQRGQVLP